MIRSLIFILATNLLLAQVPKPSAPTTASVPAAIKFEDIAARAGVRFITRNSATPDKNQIETMVAGVALLDYDGDGYLDIYLVNGAAIPSLKKESPAY